jgi:hypothetical protein
MVKRGKWEKSQDADVSRASQREARSGRDFLVFSMFYVEISPPGKSPFIYIGKQTRVSSAFMTVPAKKREKVLVQA